MRCINYCISCWELFSAIICFCARRGPSQSKKQENIVVVYDLLLEIKLWERLPLKYCSCFYLYALLKLLFTLLEKIQVFILKYITNLSDISLYNTNLPRGLLIPNYFCAVYDYSEKADLSKAYWNPINHVFYNGN